MIDPRAASPPFQGKRPQPVDRWEEVAGLHRLCREGRLYEIEEWIRASRPLQLSPTCKASQGRASALSIAIERGNFALAVLLLANGYDPNLERRSALERALDVRRWDLVDLLLQWGADPQSVYPYYILATYTTAMFDRFYELGVDLTRGHEMSAILGDHTRNKPLFGFVKRHREQDPRIAMELQIALNAHAEHGNARGVALCLWAGADPHVPAPRPGLTDLFDESADGAPEDRYVGLTAVETAVADGSVEILRRLGPDPTRDDFRELYRSARDGSMVEALAEIAPPPAEIGNIVLHQLVWGEFSSRRDAVGALRALFRCGSKWAVATPTEVADVRRQLLKAGDYRFVELMRLLSEGENCSPAILAELVRTPTIRERMRQVGFLRQETPLRRGYPPERPTGTAKVLKKCGIVEPKHEWLPHSVTIGSGMGACERLKLTREEFYKLIWSEPVDVLARRWGVSGRGLGKTCARFKVPTPPRGYWARVRNGQRVARTPLPRVPAGTLQEVVVLVPSRRDPRASAHPAGHAEQPMGD